MNISNNEIIRRSLRTSIDTEREKQSVIIKLATDEHDMAEATHILLGSSRQKIKEYTRVLESY